MGRGSGWAEGRAGPRERAAHSEKVVKALGLSTELGQVVHEAVALLVSKQVHQVAGIHSCKGTPWLWAVSQPKIGLLGWCAEQEGPRVLTYPDALGVQRLGSLGGNGGPTNMAARAQSPGEAVAS